MTNQCGGVIIVCAAGESECKESTTRPFLHQQLSLQHAQDMMSQKMLDSIIDLACVRWQVSCCTGDKIQHNKKYSHLEILSEHHGYAAFMMCHVEQSCSLDDKLPTSALPCLISLVSQQL